MSPYVRTVKTSSGGTAVQIVYSFHRGSREIEHLGSAHSDAEVELLKAAARQRLAAGQDDDLGLRPAASGSGPLPITASRMGHLLDALEHAYRVLGLEKAAGGDEVFRDLVLARIIEPSSKLDSLRVLEEAGAVPASYPTVCRRLRAYAKDSWRAKLSAACAAHARLSRASLVLYDVSTLYSRPMPGTGSGSRDSPRNAGWNHRSLSACAMRRCVFGGGGRPPWPVCRRRWVEAEGSLARAGVLRAGWQAALTKSGRASTARWRGSGERVEKVYARNQCVIPR